MSTTTTGITVEEYDAMIAAGEFDHIEEPTRIELIRGEIVEVPGPNPPHSEAVKILSYWSFDNLPRDKAHVRVQDAVGMHELDSVPLPDVLWINNGDYRYKRPTGQDVLLLIEVADSSLRYDRTTKAQVYAETGIADYWIVNLPDRVVEVHRDPAGRTYRDVRSYGAGESIATLAIPEVVLSVDDLWPQ